MDQNQFINEISPTKITDVNVDCLHLIFDFLTLDDFLSLADTSKFMRNAVESTFRRRFSKKHFHLCRLKSKSTDKRHISVDKEVRVSDFRSGLQLLRCFGHLIHKLNILDLSTVKYKRIVTYLNDYCTDSLTYVCVHAIPNSASKQLQPFKNIETLLVLDSYMNGVNLDEIFPRLRTLCYRGYDYGALENHFPNLESLEILGNWDRDNDRAKKSIETTLRMNPQLRSLKAPCNPDARFIQIASENLPQLQNFDITWDQKVIPNYDTMSFHFENLKKFDFKLHVDGMQRFQLTKIPFTFTKLDELVSMGLSFNDEFLEFLGRNPFISKLTFLKPSNLSKSHIQKLVKALPMLNEVTFRFCLTSVQIKEIVRSLEEIKTLKRCHFLYFDDDEVPLKSLKAEWKGSVLKHLLDIKKIVLERRI